MKAYRLEFNGYKRLSNTGCNVDGKMIAFLGPNEAGKSTVLQALEWFTNDTGALPRKIANRTVASDAEQAVVRVRYRLSEDDRAAVAGLGLVGAFQTFTRSKYPDGSVRTRIDPQPTRDPQIFNRSRERLQALLSWLSELNSEEDPGSAEHSRLVEAALLTLVDPEASWDSEWDPDFDALVDWVSEIDSDGADGRRFVGAESAALLGQTRDVLRAAHPDGVARQRLLGRVPPFVQFTSADRDLASVYDLSEPTLRSSPPAALANLAWIADLDLQSLWETIEDGDIARTQTAERQANGRLRDRLGPRWRQERINVQFNVNGTDLQILIVEIGDDGATTPIDERSDGLRTFVALVAFLARRNFAAPPILLADEIETHLHMDAQADLVDVLANDVEATQVFYTTHSPGCLPRDLGTGLRFVEPVAGDRSASRLRNDFWTSSRPGFTPLLFAMGASAAAFSAFRRAVFTEGASDMILLPSLLRLATKLGDLSYQVAPGLANYNGSGLELEEAAARVAYLLDGDEGGNEHEQRLLGMGIPKSRIFRLPADCAAEDLVARERYVAVVNRLLAESKIETHALIPADLTDGRPASKQLLEWCVAREISPPGKTAIATALVNEPDELVLADGADAALQGVHEALVSALAVV